ncbi:MULTISPECIES: class I SAM-dependent methyltransferase [Kocuria]|uniref:class I SAM-dependent methyltransferase n=1 Tax=Kocuria TaxID=57493 RepID=UPI00174C388B|nr:MULTISPECIES: methyltransferase [Kocuria]MCT1546151.1 class I SAM-dependent methyltransferase [Kocuria rhizophila]MCT2171737.1 class I SAM-dependent methyltransferase [Kocuria rhizophila]MDN3462266.1 methyltransferase [Kocuria sp. APC 4018]WSQ05470.1 class I SAM-dependent methyltransferase [Kocuria rhizophila]
MAAEHPVPHYFVSNPSLPEKRRRIGVELRGRHVDVVTAAGVFSPGDLDKGTAALLRTVPDPQGTDLLDIGCGWGPITIALAQAAPEARVTAVDVNQRSLQLTAENARSLGLTGVETALPQDVPEGRTFDTIWSNPPIRVGKDALHEILTTWLPRLNPGGTAWLVVQKNLGGDSLQRWLAQTLTADFRVERAATDKGFRIIAVHRD